MRLNIRDAQRTQVYAITVFQWDARIKPNKGRPNDQGMGRKAAVEIGIRHDDGGVTIYRIATK